VPQVWHRDDTRIGAREVTIRTFDDQVKRQDVHGQSPNHVFADACAEARMTEADRLTSLFQFHAYCRMGLQMRADQKECKE
jgi:hypothetical protein